MRSSELNIIRANRPPLAINILSLCLKSTLSGMIIIHNKYSGMLQSMELQRVRHDLVIEQQRDQQGLNFQNKHALGLEELILLK